MYLRVVVVVPEVVEELRHLAPAAAAEEVGEIRRLRRGGVAFAPQRFGSRHGGRHGEELVGDVHEPEEEALLVLQLRLVHVHAVEDLAREFARGSVDESHVRCQSVEFGVARETPQPSQRDGYHQA